MNLQVSLKKRDTGDLFRDDIASLSEGQAHEKAWPQWPHYSFHNKIILHVLSGIE